MCGRYQFTVAQSAEILSIIAAIKKRYGPDAWKPGDVFPSGKAPVLLNDGAALLRWGYQLPNSLVINVRAETVMEKPLFREDFQSRRCVIPATAFYEWNPEKRKFLFAMPHGKILWMAGLYAVRDGESCYCIVTTDANPSMRDIHPRMPLVLTGKQTTLWLENREKAKELLHMEPPPLHKEPTDQQLSL